MLKCLVLFALYVAKKDGKDEVMDEDWKPPPLQDLVGEWTVESWLAIRYTRYAKSEACYKRAAALGYLQTHFRPMGSEQERSRYYALLKLDPGHDVKHRAWLVAKGMPEAFLKCVEQEILEQIEGLNRWLDRIEGEAYPPEELKALQEARYILEMAMHSLIVNSRSDRVRRELMAFDHEVKKRYESVI